MALAVVSGSGAQAHSTGVTLPAFTSTSGSLFIVVGYAWSISSALGANGDVTDSKSNTYTFLNKSMGGSSAPSTLIYMNVAGTRGASHTVTFAPGGGTTDYGIAVLEVTGADASPYDSTTFGVSNPTSSPFNVTAAAAISGNQIAVYAVNIDTGDPNAYGALSGYTQYFDAPAGPNVVAGAWRKINETGTPTVGVTKGGGIFGSRNLLATFKESGGGGTDLDVPSLHPPFQGNVYRM